MKFKTLVVSVSLFQAFIDLLGIFVSVNFDQIVDSLQGDTYSRIRLNDTYSTDISSIQHVHIIFYTLPYLFSGVIPRMLNGFECLTADQLVIQYSSEWKQINDLKENHGELPVKFPDAAAYWDTVIEETVSKINRSLARRRKHCQQSKYRIPNLRMSDIDAEDFVEDFLMRKDMDINKKSVQLMNFFELMTMAGNSAASLLIVLLVKYQFELPLLNMPWLLLTAIEITGNVCVAVAFGVLPGYCILTSLICITRTIWLGTIWSKVIRNHLIRELPINAGYDQERRTLRHQLSYKGKVRLSRFFGSYA